MDWRDELLLREAMIKSEPLADLNQAVNDDLQRCECEGLSDGLTLDDVEDDAQLLMSVKDMRAIVGANQHLAADNARLNDIWRESARNSEAVATKLQHIERGLVPWTILCAVVGFVAGWLAK